MAYGENDVSKCALGELFKQRQGVQALRILSHGFVWYNDGVVDAVVGNRQKGN